MGDGLFLLRTRHAGAAEIAETSVGQVRGDLLPGIRFHSPIHDHIVVQPFNGGGDAENGIGYSRFVPCAGGLNKRTLFMRN